MYRTILVLTILFTLTLIGCSDDESDSGPGTPAGDSCANVTGSWSTLLEIESGYGGVLSRAVELTQSDNCTVTGTMVLGLVIEGHTTDDSLYFSYGEIGAAPEDQVHCALAIIDKYLMEGQYSFNEESGVMTMHGPDPDCSGTVVMQVTAGLFPTFSWQPECSVSFMLIEPLDDGSDQWMVGNENANDLDSGITYGVAPAGVNSRDVIPLVAGTAYKVILYRWLGAGDAYLMAGYALLIP